MQTLQQTFKIEEPERKESFLEMNCPVLLSGRTEKSDDGHRHHYSVFIDEEVNFSGGSTDEVEGHSHTIKSGTLTELKEDHVHKYSFIEAIMELGNEEEN